MRQKLGEGYRKNMSQDQRLQQLSAENAELKLYLASLIRLLVSQKTINTTDLASIVDAVDAEDGTADGKFSGDIKP